MVDLPSMPSRIAALPRDERGYPVPWFVAWMKDGELRPPGEGEPDFRIVAPKKLWTAYRKKLCWICGGKMSDRGYVHVIGPMCVVNRVTSEPSSHRDCATFAAKACPFLTRPRQKRDAKGLPNDMFVAGTAILRNPGAVCLYQTRKVTPFEPPDGGVLFQLGRPTRIEWYAQGRIATRAEIEASIESGYPLLLDEARRDGVEGVRALEQMAAEAMKLLPAA
jgi:hypothetical protein